MRIVVTGAFGYSGKYITQRLLQAGHEVLTLTNSLTRPNPFGAAVRAMPFNFDQPALLRESLAGADALINTYWVRFDHALFRHDTAVANTRTLFQSAKAAGIKRIVHVSITNPDIRSPLPYFRGKAELETALQDIGCSYSILRPTVLFGKEDVLINNIAWGIRHLPVFGVFGDGQYRLQPIYVDDLAALAVDQVQQSQNAVIDAIGPETFTYRGLVEHIAETLSLKRKIIRVSPAVGYWSCTCLGWVMRDIVITREEIQGLMEGRLCVQSPPVGTTKLSAWIKQHRDTLGLHYTSEMQRRTHRGERYGSN
ncbi:MAG: NAD-dependent epimerase/dehydratase family protein [Verrucomicrobiota bacterium]